MKKCAFIVLGKGKLAVLTGIAAFFGFLVIKKVFCEYNVQKTLEQIMENKTKLPHGITVENRIKTTITGVEKVVTSCDTALCIISTQGAISVQGKDLKIENFSVEDGVFSFCGTVNCIKYAATKTPVLKKIFK